MHFKRVRRLGKSYAHPLVVLVAFAIENQPLQVGVVASRAIGNAVQRNRAKRLLRAAIAPHLPHLPANYHLILIARPPILMVKSPQVEHALLGLLRRARLIGA
ncbi:MAG: hypothetical protein OHK0052_01940 [Anaerolineales bacterium]